MLLRINLLKQTLNTTHSVHCTHNIQGLHAFQISGNILEFDNYQGPGNTPELQKNA